MAVCVVCPSFHKKVYPGVPPIGLTVASPLFPPLKKTFVWEDTVVVNAAEGSDMLTELVVVQPFASVILTVYNPIANPVAVCVVCPLLHRKVYPGVPPEALAVASPLLPPLQETFV